MKLLRVSRSNSQIFGGILFNWKFTDNFEFGHNHEPSTIKRSIISLTYYTDWYFKAIHPKLIAHVDRISPGILFTRLTDCQGCRTFRRVHLFPIALLNLLPVLTPRDFWVWAAGNLAGDPGCLTRDDLDALGAWLDFGRHCLERERERERGREGMRNKHKEKYTCLLSDDLVLLCRLDY